MKLQTLHSLGLTNYTEQQVQQFVNEGKDQISLRALEIPSAVLLVLFSVLCGSMLGFSFVKAFLPFFDLSQTMSNINLNVGVVIGALMLLWVMPYLMIVIDPVTTFIMEKIFKVEHKY